MPAFTEVFKQIFVFAMVFIKQHHLQADKRVQRQKRQLRFLTNHCLLGKHSVHECHQVLVLCNSSGSGNVTYEVNLIGWPALVAV